MNTINMENMKETDKLQTDEVASKMQADEVVQYISQRHHVPVGDVLACFTMQVDGEICLRNQHSVELEENEIQIIHDLVQMYHK